MKLISSAWTKIASTRKNERGQSSSSIDRKKRSWTHVLSFFPNLCLVCSERITVFGYFFLGHHKGCQVTHSIDRVSVLLMDRHPVLTGVSKIPRLTNSLVSSQPRQPEPWWNWLQLWFFPRNPWGWWDGYSFCLQHRRVAGLRLELHLLARKPSRRGVQCCKRSPYFAEMGRTEHGLTMTVH